MSVNNCYICLTPLNSGTIYTLHPEALEADAKHQIHKNCLIQSRDLTFLEDPLATDFPCGLCRKRVTFTTPPSAQTIINWSVTIENTIIIAGRIIGLIGFIAGPPILNRFFHLSDKISKLSYSKIINISLRFLPFLIIEIASRLFQYKGRGLSWIINHTTRIYNWKHETVLLPRDIIVYDWAMKDSFEKQLSLIGNHTIYQK